MSPKPKHTQALANDVPAPVQTLHCHMRLRRSHMQETGEAQEFAISYLADGQFLLREKVAADGAYAALDIAQQRQPVIASFCNSQDPKHPSKHISPQGVEVRVYRLDEPEPATD